VEALLNLTTVSAGFDMFSSWASAFLLGRLIVHAIEPAWIYGACAVIFSIVAILAIIEYSTSINPFVDLLRFNNSLYEIWGTLQPRGGLLRAEGAFGHSIALGASLAMVIVLTLASSLPIWLRFAMAALMSVAIVLSFSRIGMVTAALGIVLFCIFDHGYLRQTYRVVLLVIAVLASAAALTFISDVFLSAGNEAQGSAEYRSQLLALTTDLAPLGLAPAFNISTTREVSVGSFGSIDNAVLLFGIQYGWLPAIVPLAGLLAAGLLVLRRRATPPTIALVAQIPAFFTVALITQYAAIVWLFAGLAVGTQAMARESASTMGRLPATAVPTFLALQKLPAMYKGMNHEV
jgi:hypothetical protein